MRDRIHNRIDAYKRYVKKLQVKLNDIENKEIKTTDILGCLKNVVQYERTIAKISAYEDLIMELEEILEWMEN